MSRQELAHEAISQTRDACGRPAAIEPQNA
jgi:hypothetical protein